MLSFKVTFRRLNPLIECRVKKIQNRLSVGADVRTYSIDPEFRAQPRQAFSFWTGCVDVSDRLFKCECGLSLIFDEIIDPCFKSSNGVVTFTSTQTKDTVTVDIAGLQLLHDVIES